MGQGGQRADDREIAEGVTVIGFETPEGHQVVRLHAIAGFDLVQQVPMLLQQRPTALNPLFRNRVVHYQQTSNALPDAERDWLLQAKQENPRATLRSFLRAQLPTRLADALADRLDLESPLGGLSNAALEEAQSRLVAWPFVPNGSEGFAKAEVTVGGVSTAELSSKTMEATRVPGLYVIGEAVDVTGWLGGYNFQWAWASGWAAAQAL